MHVFIILLLGLAINGYNAEKAGNGIHNVEDLKTAVVESFDTRQAVYKVND